MPDHTRPDDFERHLNEALEVAREEQALYETLDYLASLLPADAPAVYRERIETIRHRLKRGRFVMSCG